MIYELRVYHTMPGKLPALLNRFDTITLKIWERHGIQQAGFWTTLVGESNADLTYLLKWESLAEREKKWDDFQADPEWIAKRAETEEGRPDQHASVENSFLVPTSFLVGEIGARPSWRGQSPAMTMARQKTGFTQRTRYTRCPSGS